MATPLPSNVIWDDQAGSMTSRSNVFFALHRRASRALGTRARRRSKGCHERAQDAAPKRPGRVPIQRATTDHAQNPIRSGERGRLGTLAHNAKGLWNPNISTSTPPPGIWSHHWAGTGFTAARHHEVCGRQPHRHPRRLGSLAKGSAHRRSSSLATHTLIQKKSNLNMLVNIDGILPPGVTAKDNHPAVIGEIARRRHGATHANMPARRT